MSFVMPEIVIQKALQKGMADLRANKAAFDDLFAQYAEDELTTDYGANYIELIWQWFSTAKIPVVQAWSFNVTRIPGISIRLANEVEDEQKAALYDLAFEDSDGELGTGVFTATIDIGVHASKSGDHVLWLYYITAYILFKQKRMLERLGLKLSTFSASDYDRELQKAADNVWTRWIRLKCTTQNFWDGNPATEIEEVNLEHTISNGPASDISGSGDVIIEEVDGTANGGIKASRPGDPDGIDDLGI